MCPTASEPVELLNQKEAAAKLTISARQLRRIPDEITCRLPDGSYPWPELQKGYVRWKQQEGLERRGHGKESEYEKARGRKVAAQARMAELEVARLEGRLIGVETLTDVTTQLVDRLVATLKQLPGAWAPQLAGLESPRDVAKVLHRAIGEAIDDLRLAVDDLIESDGLDDAA